MKSSSILSILSLIAGALGLNTSAADYNVHAAKHTNKVAKFKEEHGLSDEESEKLGAVLRAAETAPVSADASRAAGLFADDTVAGTKPLEEPADPTNETGEQGDEGQPGVPESVDDLVSANTKDQLLTLAENEGVEVHASQNKDEIAQAIIDARNDV